MKKSILKMKYAFIALVLVTSISCSSDDDSGAVVSSPTISYSSPTVEASFFKEGQSSTPSVNWNNNQGLFSLTTSLEGLSINTNSGVLSWTKALPQGKHNIEVVAKNSAGQTSVSLTLKNYFHGTFIGKTSGFEFLEINFNIDGSVIVGVSSDPRVLGYGTWQIKENTIRTSFRLDNGKAFSMSGVLNQTNTEVIYTGNWYDGLIPTGYKRWPFSVLLK